MSFHNYQFSLRILIAKILQQNNWPQKLMVAAPFLFYFPVSLMYVWLALFLIAWSVKIDLQQKWRTTITSPLFYPLIAILSVITLNVLFLSQTNYGRWSALVHYLIYFFLLIFLSLGGGKWQKKAKKVFFVGALYGASIFYLAHFSVLPEWTIFKNYITYGGNKSIALGIFLSLAAAWLLNDSLAQPERRRALTGLLGYIYIAIAVLFLAKTRTGMLLLVILSLLVMTRHIKMSFRGIALLLSFLLLTGLAWKLSPHMQARTLVTLEGFNELAKGEISTGQNNRLQFIQKTSEMIFEKPWLGHGVGSWLQQYPVRAQGLETSLMSTPHNDYLLYTAELGFIGLVALLCVFGRLLTIAWRTGGAPGMQLLVITSAFVLGCALNAILRDWKFGLPMAILLVIAITDDENDASVDVVVKDGRVA
jgi:O-antigen ligase